MKVYIAGPMTNLPAFNFPAFYAMEDMLREMGFKVLNPADIGDEGWDRQENLRHCFRLLTEADALVALDGWKDSVGARAEVVVASLLGLKLFSEDFNELEYDLEVDLP